MRFRDQKKQLGAMGESAYDDAISGGATAEQALAMAQAAERQAAEQIAAGFSGSRFNLATGAGFEEGMFSSALDSAAPIEIAASGDADFNGESLNGTDGQGRAVDWDLPPGGYKGEVNKNFPPPSEATENPSLSSWGRDVVGNALFPNIATWGERGTPGTFMDGIIGFAQGAYNTASDLGMMVTPGGHLLTSLYGDNPFRTEIADRRLGGAAFFEGVSVVGGAFASFGRLSRVNSLRTIDALAEDAPARISFGLFGRIGPSVGSASYDISYGVRALRTPALDAKLSGSGTLGYTTANGDVFLQPGMSRAQQIATLRHESVHSYLSVPDSGFLAGPRQGLMTWGYNNSNVLRYFEEAVAEGYSTRSVVQGLRFPLENGYVTGAGLAVEGSAVSITYGGLLYGTYKLSDER